MQVLNRLKMELSNHKYFTDKQYIQFPTDNRLTPTSDYVKANIKHRTTYVLSVICWKLIPFSFNSLIKSTNRLNISSFNCPIILYLILALLK